MIGVIKSSELGAKIDVQRCKKQWSGFGVCGRPLSVLSKFKQTFKYYDSFSLTLSTEHHCSRVHTPFPTEYRGISLRRPTGRFVGKMWAADCSNAVLQAFLPSQSVHHS